MQGGVGDRIHDTGSRHRHTEDHRNRQVSSEALRLTFDVYPYHVAALRWDSVVEHVTVADLANASIPDSINVLADDPEAWVTR